jgi:predicted flap endonuclease-1-like 5' DNA nuclease
MTMLVLQTLLLMAIAYILGCIIGCLLHQWFGTAEKAAVAAAPVAAAAMPRVTPPAPPPPPVARAVTKPKSAPKRATAKKRVSTPRTAAPAAKDDLKRISGIGRQNEARLNAIGVTTFAQIAAWTKKEQADIGERLAFPGRIEREEWAKQAAKLAKGGQTEFSKRVAKGEVATSSGKGSVGDLGTKPAVSSKPQGGKADNLTLIDGVGNAIEKKLNALGIFHFEQIARWNAANQVWIGNEIGFPGRPERENWVGEAKILASGGTTAHARAVESGKIATSRKSKPGENK